MQTRRPSRVSLTNYRVAAYTPVGTSAYSNTASLGLVPTAPSGLGATAVSTSEIDLAWNDTSFNETAFLVEMSIDNITFVQEASLAAGSISYRSTRLAAGTTYYYRVRAMNASGVSAYSATAAATTFGLPAAPSSLTATSVSKSQINLTWRDNSTNELGFSILRSRDGLIYAQIATVGMGVNTFADTGLASGTKYYYRVKSYNTFGTSGASNTASATTKNK